MLQDFTVKAEKAGTNTQVHCMVDLEELGWNFFKIRKEQKLIQTVYEQWCDALNVKQRDQIGKSKLKSNFTP